MEGISEGNTDIERFQDRKSSKEEGPTLGKDSAKTASAFPKADKSFVLIVFLFAEQSQSATYPIVQLTPVQTVPKLSDRTIRATTCLVCDQIKKILALIISCGTILASYSPKPSRSNALTEALKNLDTGTRLSTA